MTQNFATVDNTKYMFRKGSPNSKEYRREMQANQFAAALLMPENLIFKAIDEFEDRNFTDHELIKELARKFKVSEIAMTYRLNNIGIFYN